MRLLPRRRRDKARDARPGVDLPAEDTAREETAGAAARHEAAGRPTGPAHWRRLAPLAPTVHRPPLTVAATMGVLADERNRPLIHTPGRTSRAAVRQENASGSAPFAATADDAAVGVVEPVAGRVTGLIVVRAEAPPDPEPPEPSPAPRRRPTPTAQRAVTDEPVSEPSRLEPPRLAPRVLATPGPRPSLVKAADEYVGDPEPETTRYASSAWLRMIESYRPPWAGGGTDAPPGSAVAPPPIPEGGGSWSSEAAIAPPRAPRTPAADAPRPARRASLAESRRLGLGNPLRQPSSQDPDVEEQSSQDAPAGAETADDSSTARGGMPGESAHGRPHPPAAPAVASVPISMRMPEAGPQPATDVDEAAGEGGSGRRAPDSSAPTAGSDAPTAPPRLGLAAPIDRPVRRLRRSSPESRPTALRTQPPPTPEDPRPRPQADGGAVQEAAAQTGNVEPSHPAPQPAGASDPAVVEPTPHDTTPPDPAPRRAVLVYRFVPGERPTQADAALPRPTLPTPAAPLPAAPPPTPTAPSSASAPTAPSTPPPTSAEPSRGLPTLESRQDRSLTYPAAQQPSDGAGAEAGPRPQTRSPGPVQPQRPASIGVPESARAADPLRRPRWEQFATVPYELLDVVRRTQGVDVSDVPIRRGPEVAAEARSLGARSFTRGGEVFLPAQEGPPDRPVARGLLAHELTHAAQQRVLGPALPAEDSPAGRVLEAQAVAAERWARGLGGDPAADDGAVAAGSSWTAPWHTASTPGVQRQADDVTSVAGPEYAAGSSAAPADAPAAEPQTPQGSAGGDEEMDAARDKLLALSRRRPLDLDDPSDIEELSVRIYQRIHRRLRRDLVVDRERAGRLGETGPFGPAR